MKRLLKILPAMGCNPMAGLFGDHSKIPSGERRFLEFLQILLRKQPPHQIGYCMADDGAGEVVAGQLIYQAITKSGNGGDEDHWPTAVKDMAESKNKRTENQGHSIAG